MKNTKLMTKLVAALFVLALIGPGAFAQAPPPPPPPPPPAQDAPRASAVLAQAQPLRTYKLDFSINELDGGKKVDSRQYSMVMNNFGRPGDVRAGTRVPAGVKSDGTVEYLDVNTSINVNLYNRGGQDAADVSCNVTSMAPGTDPASARPVLRTFSISGGSALLEGRPIVLGVADDPNTKRQFQLEMTVTELK